MPSALILLADGTEEMEFTITYDTFVRAGIQTQSVFVPNLANNQTAGSVSPPAAKGSRGINIMPDMFFDASACSPDKYDALVIPGGAKGAETMSKSSEVQGLVKAFIEQKKYVGMICAGSLAALTSGLPKQPLTSHPGVKDKLVNDFDYSEEPVVVSGTLVTSRSLCLSESPLIPGTTFPFALTMRKEVHGPMVFPAGTPW
ncbi:DJ-1 [Mucidula mucida]|nr:DJ-1 [Mucidula mucida]